MLDRLPTLPHGLGVPVEAALHRFQHVLMFPARDPTLLAGCAVRFQRTVAACIGPIAPEPLPVLFVGVVVAQLLAGRITADIAGIFVMSANDQRHWPASRIAVAKRILALSVGQLGL